MADLDEENWELFSAQDTLKNMKQYTKMAIEASEHDFDYHGDDYNEQELIKQTEYNLHNMLFSDWREDVMDEDIRAPLEEDMPVRDRTELLKQFARMEIAAKMKEKEQSKSNEISEPAPVYKRTATKKISGPRPKF